MSDKKETTFFRKTLRNGSLAFSSLVLSAMILVGCIYFYLAWRLPDVAQLKDARLQVPLRIYSSDGKLLGEFGEKKRIPVALNQVPKQLIQAILDTEDQRFFEHPGVDFIGLIRAAKAVFASGRKSQGASTITMQVARNFFFNSDKTYARKLNEIMLALKIDQAFSKQEILELYLNKIYLGQRAYGVASASHVYYGKNLNELTLAELAMLAGLPQAPSRANPVVNPEAALERRNHVLTRMYDDGHIDAASYKKAIASPNTASYHEGVVAEIQAPYVAEMVRQAMVEQFGQDVYDRGYTIYTTIDSRLQNAANQSLRNGVIAYDRRHGYRGAEQNLGEPSKNKVHDWRHTLQGISTINNLIPAAVIAHNEEGITALIANGTEINLPWSKLSLAVGNDNKNNGQIKLGDVIRIEKGNDNQWRLGQIPEVEAALVSLNPQNGAIAALTGGFAYNKSNFNRATQADRQTGSAFKPFIYSAALDKGFTLASVINDAPVVIADTATTIWRPQNDSGNFHGPTRLRVGLMKSTNLVSVRLLQSIGLSYALNYLQRFGFVRGQVSPGLSLALGATSISPVQLASGYATFANGGYKITPYFINTIKDQNDKVIFQAQPKIAPPYHEQSSDEEVNKPSPNPNSAMRTIDIRNAYLMTDAMKDVIRQGTATKALSLNRHDLAGKTGTTNNQNDGWFCGFNGDLVTAAWVGFDKSQSIGEHGNQDALPIWIDFMGEALNDKPENAMPEPEGIVTSRIDPHTGLRAAPGQKGIFEIFARKTAPTQIASETSTSDSDEEGNADEATNPTETKSEGVDAFTEPDSASAPVVNAVPVTPKAQTSRIVEPKKKPLSVTTSPIPVPETQEVPIAEAPVASITPEPVFPHRRVPAKAPAIAEQPATSEAPPTPKDDDSPLF